MEERNLDQTGQHYMIDKSVIAFIVENSDLEKEDVVLEIGYGKGALTKELAKKCKVIAIDIKEHKLDVKNATFITGNILKMFNELYEKYKFNKIVANIPYNISEPLMRLMFKKHSEIELIVLTIGQNFSNILSQTDNRIGIITNKTYELELLKIVKPKSFSPAPRVDSAVIKLIPKYDSSSNQYIQLILLDDKLLKNALENIITTKTKKEIKALTIGSLFEKKLYELSNTEFIQLSNFLEELDTK
ncbi:MAG: ribosomal RNA small subunit methyltransferase A [Candidatus Woesearchaeota archaeon]